MEIATRVNTGSKRISPTEWIDRLAPTAPNNEKKETKYEENELYSAV